MRVEFTREYLSWVNDLSDPVGRSRVLQRVHRLAEGNPGSYRYLGKGVLELKIDFGPGYRVYYLLLGARRLVVLFGGDKGTQARDIQKAMELGRRYRER